MTSNEGSTASLASCSDWKNFKPSPEKPTEVKSSRLQQIKKACTDSLEEFGEKFNVEDVTEKSNDSLDSIQSEKGGEITFHRYYHVFREGELDSLIEKYVENLHIISSYYDHSSWCIIAEKVQVWTI